MTYQPTPEDREREQKMRALINQIDNPKITPEIKSFAWLKYQALHRQRSPELVQHIGSLLDPWEAG